MEFSENANYCTLPSVDAAPIIDYIDPASVNDSATFNNCISEYFLIPPIESDFSPPTDCYFPYCDPLHEQLHQMRRLNGEVDLNDCYSLQTNNNNLFMTSSFGPKHIESGMPNVVKPVSECEARDLWNSPSETDMNQVVNHQKKRMKTDENDGCKGCNCKMSKCLKRYCACFDAERYCDSCACEDCFNKPIYESKVIEARRQIKSRDESAFGPKIVQPAISPAINNANPALVGRHKRGCNCRKSMCQKKYCECYQGDIGCSSGCRCEGCKNIFGTREDYKHREEDVIFYQNINDNSNAKQDEQQPLNSPSFTPPILHTGNKSGKNQNVSTPSLPTSYEQFGIPVNTTHQSHINVTSSTTPTLDNSNNLIYPENVCLPSTYSPQLRGSLTQISQFNGVIDHNNIESYNPTQRVDTPDILLDNFDHFFKSPNTSPYKELCLQHIMLEVLSMDPPLLTEVPGNSYDGGHQTSFPPLMH